MSKQFKKAALLQQMKKIWESCQSDYCEVKGSEIHGRGVYAVKKIPNGEKIIEYAGELIDKEESVRRANLQSDKAEKNGDAAVYIFTISDKWDLDGNFPWNIARLINHSCEPNCEAWIDGKKIFIHALRDIKKGEELSFDYGFEIDTWEDHLCRCGKATCVGHIVSQSQWSELRMKIAEKSAKKKSKLSKTNS
jgi:uncharacterized protein